MWWSMYGYPFFVEQAVPVPVLWYKIVYSVTDEFGDMAARSGGRAI